MIAAVGLAPGLIRSLKSPGGPEDLAELMDRHMSVIEPLRDHSSVVMSSADDITELRAALSELAERSPDVRKRWEELLVFLRKRRRFEAAEDGCRPPLDAIETSADLMPEWKGRIEVAALPATQAARLGVGPASSYLEDAASHIEITKGNLLRRSRKIGRYAGLAKAGLVPEGSDRDQWLAEVLMPLIRRATRVDIVDRYLYVELKKRDGRRGAGIRPAEHVGWLLDAVRRAEGPPKHVRLVGGVGESVMPPDAASARALVRDAYPGLGGAVAELQIVGAKWRPQRLPHDRHISFDLGLAIEIPAGLDRFSRKTIIDPEGVTWLFRSTPAGYGKCRDERDRILAATDTRVLRY